MLPPDLQMTDLESTRPGWIGRAIGVSFILAAIGLTAWDLSAPSLRWIAWFNIVTLAAGVVNFHLGTVRIRTARKHHESMEELRRQWAEVAS
jgi:hypothetical protein